MKRRAAHAAADSRNGRRVCALALAILVQVAFAQVAFAQVALTLLGGGIAMSIAMPNAAQAAEDDLRRFPERPVRTGADILVASGFSVLEGKRVGLVTNHTALVDGRHLADLLHEAPGVRLTAILAPEHGFRGAVEAGKKVSDDVDQRTGVPVYSLYGSTRKPTSRMLRDVDILVFDIQDIGARFYTYISTMGLAMQAAAEAGLPFVVLDRPNPLGGEYVSGFVLEKKHTSFVGQYPIPIVHGLTVGELAHMIKGERWLSGLDALDLHIVALDGWRRDMRWPLTGLPWVATSPNIPTFKSALVYPGIGVLGETQIVNEGRGTDEPFTVFGAPWLDAVGVAAKLDALNLPGVRFEADSYVPKSIPGVAENPVFVGRRVAGVRLVVTDIARFEPLETGIHALAAVLADARRARVSTRFKNIAMFHLIAGTRDLHRMLMRGQSGTAIVAAWRRDAAAFKARSKAYHLY